VIVEHRGYQIDDNQERLDFERVHAWLASTYWSPGVARERVEKAARNSSLVVGVYQGDEQVGYLRIVSDKTTFAWVCDVFVDEAHRGKGIARAMVRYAQDHPDHLELRRWILATRDAHDVYAGVGFELIPNPERWMIWFPPPSVAQT
jgi:GNAT superfamily N-acetyltransferase